MIELRLIGDPAEIDAAPAAMGTVLDVHRGRHKPARGCDDGQVIQYGVLIVRATRPRTGEGRDAR